ncbi:MULTISPECIES: hypothetical protein [Pseudomonas]|jgi:hypothetical protein|uniref:Uncharacterized protein n=1 Tax=Pseudomonas soli TaxID=1306993 RepID=A0A1H9KVJ9_9PSED|nr:MULTISPECIES: hypothetical protein [Pseudomonas]AIN59259.1 hypothetical protein O165_013600 [Pseudomonas soli]MCX5507027.1 hypothetical protein [Pseudomonas sp. BJa3]MDT3714974.1 hypothetical protein [Pseudomonas soli]MDT3731387.1 hypothetical protein [Pseudomonas soli]MEE1879845.1 hypothetical protein [Pseudomonas soli]
MNGLTMSLLTSAQTASIPRLAPADRDAAAFQACLIEQAPGAPEQWRRPAVAEQQRLQVLAMAMDLLNDSFTVESDT